VSNASTFTPDDNRRTLRNATSRGHTWLLITALCVFASVVAGLLGSLATFGLWGLVVIPLGVLLGLAISVANAILHGLDVLADMSALAQLEAARHSNTVGPPVTRPAPVASPSRSP
jgi:hypothetical protein